MDSVKTSKMKENLFKIIVNDHNHNNHDDDDD